MEIYAVLAGRLMRAMDLDTYGIMLILFNNSLFESSYMYNVLLRLKHSIVLLPGIRPTIILLLILSMGRVMEVGFDQVFMLQNSNANQIADLLKACLRGPRL